MSAFTDQFIAPSFPGLTKKPKAKFTTEEDEILRRYYFDKGALELSQTLLPKYDRVQIASHANVLGLHCSPSVVCNNEDLSHLIDVKDPFVAYMLGFLWADGHVNKRTSSVRFAILDKDFSEIKDRWMATAKSWRYKFCDRESEKRKSIAIVLIQHKAFHAFLVQCGYLFKSGDSADEILSVIPRFLQHYWWRGYFDGDGCFSFRRSRSQLSITSCYDQDWKFFATLATQANLTYSVYKVKTGKHKRSNLVLTNEASMVRFMEYIYQGESFGLSRKRLNYDRYLQVKEIIRTSKTSRYRGVHVNKRRKGCAMRIVKNKVLICKYFKTELDAARAYDQKATKLFGEKAVLNFPPIK